MGAVFGAISLERERDTLKIKVKYQDLILRISGEYSKERYKFVTRNHQVGQLMRTLQQNRVIQMSGNTSLHPVKHPITSSGRCVTFCGTLCTPVMAFCCLVLAYLKFKEIIVSPFE